MHCGVEWFRPDRAFVWLALLFGVPLAAITAPFQAPDEPQHFLRAYQVSEGGMLPVRVGPHGGGVLPVSLVSVPKRFRRLRFHPEAKTSWREVRAVMRVPLEPGKRAFMPFVTAIYSPVGYVPQAIAIGIGRLFRLNPLALMYLARWANLLAWVGMGYAALRITPVCARPLVLLLLMPMSLFQAASMSADPTTNGLAVLFAAMVMRMALSRSERKVTGLTWAGLTVVSAALTLTKFAYLPICALALLIPADRFGSKARRAAALVVFFVANVAVILLWAPQTRGLDAMVRDDAGVLPRGQIEYLRAHQAAIVTVAANTFSHDWWAMLRSFVGWLGSMDARMPAAFAVLYLVALFLACWSAENPPAPLAPGKLAVLVLGVSAASMFAIVMLNYVYWTPVGASRVEGMQGRYLLPLAPAMVFLAWSLTRRMPPFPWRGLDPETLDPPAAAVAIAGSLCAVATVLFRYY